VSDEQRLVLDGKLVAQLSQNMNFVMDLSVIEFLVMHAKSRLGSHPETLIKECLACANNLAGEQFSPNTKVTQLSGGQSRALMIADTAYLSASPIVLIDEIENAGIDRRQAIDILVNKEKIVITSTHDPLLALNADKRIVIKNGGIHRIIESSPEEKSSLALIEEWDNALQSIRQQLRRGETVILGKPEKQREKRLCGNYTI
jgi:ABC-type lipoprotein export system ATPase subunit